MRFKRLIPITEPKFNTTEELKSMSKDDLIKKNHSLKANYRRLSKLYQELKLEYNFLVRTMYKDSKYKTKKSVQLIINEGRR